MIASTALLSTPPSAVHQRRHDLLDRLLLITLALAALCAVLLRSPRTADAGTGLVAVVSNGKTPDLKLFTMMAEAAAKDSGWTLAATPLDPRATREASTCMDRDRPLPCLASLISPRGADRMLLLKVGASTDDNAVLQITAIVVLGSNGTPSTAERFCRTCDDSQVGTAVNELVRSLIQSAAVTSGRTVVAITATAPDAWIYLDGDRVPATSAGATTRVRVPTFPGAHTATVEKAGFETKILKIEAIEDRTTEVAADLRSTGSTTSPDPRTHNPQFPAPSPWRGRIGWGLIISGATTVAIGGILFAVDEDQPPRGNPRNEQYFDSAAFGAGLMIGGAALAAGGAAYLLLTRPHPRPPSASGPPAAPTAPSLPTLTPLPGGAAVGWVKAF